MSNQNSDTQTAAATTSYSSQQSDVSNINVTAQHSLPQTQQNQPQSQQSQQQNQGLITIDISHQTFQSWIDALVDPTKSEDVKLKIVQELSFSLELMPTLPTYSQLIDSAIHRFIIILNETEPQFIAESSTQQMRKKVLEIIQRMAPLINQSNNNSQTNLDQRTNLIRELLTIIYGLIEKENEENLVICLKIIIEYQRHLKTVSFDNEVKQYFNFVKNIYRDLANNVQLVFNYQSQKKVNDINEINLEKILSETYSSFQIVTEKQVTTATANKDNTQQTQTITQQQIFTIIPRGSMSLKVLADCPLNTVMMYQINKHLINHEIGDIIAMISQVIALQPTEEQRLAFELKEINADFVTAQVKALSFIAYLKSNKDMTYLKSIKDYLNNNADLIVTGILQLLKNCPPELVNVRKDLLAISRHLIGDLRMKFLPYIGQFFDETFFCSAGYTASESLRSNAASIVAELVHNARKQLTYQEICKAFTYFSKSLHDPLLHINLQHMCCKVLLSLIESVKAKDNEPNVNPREFILKLLQVFVLKFKSIAKYQVAHLLENNESINNSKPNDSILPASILITDNTTEKDNTSSTIQGNSLSDKKAKIDKLDSFLNTFEDKDKIKLKYGPSSVIIQSELDLKTTIKFLILACRSITGIIIDTKLAQTDISMTMQAKQLTPKETIIFIKLLKNALQSLDIFMLGRQQSNKTSSSPSNNTNLLNNQKEEKEAIESLGAIFSSLNPQTLKEIFTQTIDFIIERTFKNSSISILSSYFLATPATSFTFATILIEYLLKKMEIMGDTSIERSNLYLKLFKLVFGSVSVFPTENEKMLKPHLHSLVTKSLEYALKAKEPYNYFLLLRALFRSIGGGNHDLLYQEFLPLLPVLLQSLNELQTGIHKQYLKDLFVELCLTVPVRLSSLLPYLPMLMDPLVSALNGSPTLISQGLRTLELCVDNLQPDFLYDHIQPVRTDLIQGLWRTLRSQNDSIAQAAFRVLGKLGGSNRKMIVEPQKLKFNQNSFQSNLKEFNGPNIKISFTNYSTNHLELSIEKVIDTCYSILRTTSNSSISTNNQTSISTSSFSDDQIFYKKHALKIVTSFMSSLISSKSMLNNPIELNKLFSNYNPTNSPQFTQHLLKYQQFDDKHLRKTVEKSLICLIYASTIKDIKSHALSLLDSIVIHITLLSLAHYNNQDETKLQQLVKMNIFSNENSNNLKQQLLNLDFMIIIDCIYSVLNNDDTEYWPIVQRYILIMIETSEIVAGDPNLYNEYDNSELASKHILRNNLPNLALFDYLAEKINQLCYERSWLAKKASCQIIRLLTQKMPFIWVLNNFYSFLRSLMFILVSVSSEISSGAIDISQKSIEDLVKLCATKISKIETNTLTQNETNIYNQLVEQQQKSLNEVIKELIRQLTSSNIYVRTQSIKSLRLISELQSKTVHSLIQPFNDILIETVGPKKHLKLRHYPPQSQIGILDGLEFCSSTQPQLFVLNMSNSDHSNLFQELIPICEGDENQLLKNVCYKNMNDITPLRKSALNALASFYHLLEQRETILSTLHRALASTNQEIQQVAFSCLQKFIKSTENYSSALRSAHNQAVQANQNGQGPPPQPLQPGMENLRQTMQIAADYLREYLHPLTEYTSLNLNVIQHLSYITQLYPTILNEKFSEYLLTNLRRWLDEIVKIVNENKTTTQNALAAAQAAAGTLSLSALQNSLKSYENELKLCSAIISLLAELQSAPSKLVETAIATVLKYESEFMLEVNGNFRLPLSNFLKRYPFETLKYLLHSDRIKNMYNYRFILFLIRTQPEFSRIFKSDSHRLIQMLDESHSLYSNAQQMILNNTNNANSNNNIINEPQQTQTTPQTQQNPNDLLAKSNQIQYLTILIIYRLVKQDVDNKWILDQSNLIDCLLKIWCDERFHDKHRNVDQLDCVYWKEPIFLIKILLKFHKAQLDANHVSYPIQSNVELLFKLLIAFQNKSLQQYEFLRLYFKDQVAKNYTCEWKRAAFFTFVKIFNQEAVSTDTAQYQYSQRLKANVLQYILIPCFQHSFENNQHYELIGGSPQPDIDSDDNLISVFINKVVDPDNPFSISDSVRIFLLQLSSLFVQYAHDYIHDVNNKKQGNKLRRLMTFAWPCLLAKNCVDPFNKYHGHLLLSHIISKYSIHKRIVLQVFHSLLKAYAPEAKVVVRQALEILTPSFPTRIEDGYLTLASWTKKILIEESQTVPQLAHMLYIIVKYHKVYYLIRHTLINHLISSFQKVGLAANSTPENRTLSIDLTEVILRWESQRVREIQILEYNQLKQNSNLTESTNVCDFTQEQKQLEILTKKYPDMLKQFDKNVADCIINFFVRMACPPVDQSQQQNQQQQQLANNNQSNPSDLLSKRCLNLFKTAISNEIWQQADLKLDILDRLMQQLDSTNLISLNGTGIASNYQAATVNTNQTTAAASSSSQYQNTTTPNYISICTAIEIITFLVENCNGSRNKIQTILKSVQRGLTVCLMSTDSRVVKSMSQLIQKLMQILPTDCFNNNPNVNSNSTSGNSTSSSITNNQLTSPTTTSSNNPNTEQQNDPIYNLFGQPEGILCRVIIEGLSYYDKSSSIVSSLSSDSPFSSQSHSLNTSIDILTNCLLLLKSASMNNPQYIDRIMGPFMRILQKLYRDHLNSTGVVLTSNSSSILIPPGSTSAEGSNVMIGPNQTTINSFSELLIQCLDLIKFRIGVMSIEMRKMFINSILVTLIDKSIDLRLIRYLVRTISDWIKYKNGGPLMNQIPSLKEKLVLLQRLTVAVEKRFADPITDIQQIFLETIAYVYKDDMYGANNEFKIKLEQAFLCGLKCSNAKTRQLFFDLFNSNFSCVDLYERLCYILVTQNWEPFGTHYWIKQCIQMTLGSCARSETMIRFTDLAANRFHFPSLLNASECVYGNINYNSLAEVNPNENDVDISSTSSSSTTTTASTISIINNVASGGGEQTSTVVINQITEPIVINLDINMSEKIWQNADEKLLESVVDDTTEITNKKYMNIFYNKKEIDTTTTTTDVEMKTEDELVQDHQSNSKRTRSQLIELLIKNQLNLFQFLNKIKIGELIVSICQLCHQNNELAHEVWVQLFVQMFNLLQPKQQHNLYGELTPFIASGSHCIQKQASLSTLNTFLESFSMSKPLCLYLRPSLLSYLAKNHNLWHRAILLLENSITNPNTDTQNNLELADLQQQSVGLQSIQNEAFSSLSQLYLALKEDDYRTGIWYKKAIHENTKIAFMYEQQGLFYQAQKVYEEIISKSVDVYLNDSSSSSNPDELLEYNLWEERWVRCCKELNQWNELSEYATTKDNDINLCLECAFKQQAPNHWQLVKSLLLSQKDSNLPKDQSWRWSLYQTYYLVCNLDDYHHLLLASGSNPTSLQTVFSPNSIIESRVEKCIHLALKEWRRLPRLVSPAHITLLQASQQIVELQEAFQIQNNLNTLSQLTQQQQQPSQINPTSVLQEIKGIIKTWRTRLPLINDDLSYWNDIFTWRQYHYEAFTKFYEKQTTSGTNANPAMLGVHALAQGIVHFGKISRKQHLYDLCLETLNKIHKKQSVPIIDCFLKVKQEIKCYINTFEYLNYDQAQELLDVIEATNLRYFTKENVAELISLKAHFLQLCGKYDDCNHLYSFSIYLNDSQPRLWGAWGDFLTQAYVDLCSRLSSSTTDLSTPSTTNSSAFSKRSIETAESALIALLHAARYSLNECKARKYISKILWLLSYDNEKKQLYQIFDSYSSVIPPSHWINWIPQLITLLMRNDDTGKYLINVMNQIVRMYPLALYYPLRTLYLKLKNDEQTEKLKNQILAQQQLQKQTAAAASVAASSNSTDVEMNDTTAAKTSSPTTQTTPVKQQISGSSQLQQQQSAYEPVVKVTQLMHRQREMHPTLCNTVEGLIDQLLWLKVNWYEELLKNFKQTLNHCYTYSFEIIKSTKNTDISIDPFSILWFKKLHKFYNDPYWDKFHLSNNQNQANQNRVKSLLAIVKDPNYTLTRQKFLADFNYQLPSTQVNLFAFINKLKSWIKLFEIHINSLPKQQLLDEKFKFLTQFCSSTAEIEIPGEHLIPRSTNYSVKISRFLPKYESVEKYNSFSRRVSIRGHNGKVYPFLISNESTYFECRKEEHIMQLMRMMNTYLCKQKETSSRNLYYTLPRLVCLSADVRMIEDDCSSVSLLDIYKNRMKKLSSMGKLNNETKFLQMFEAGDLPLTKYYEKIQSTSSTNINKQFFVELFKNITNNLIPKSVLKEWAQHTYTDATDYFHFRKIFTQQLAIYNLAEYALCLTRLNPDQFYLSQNNGVIQAIRLKFDLNEHANNLNPPSTLSQYINDFNTDRIVPFRLTPNISEFIGSAGVNGPMGIIKIALARCLVQPQYQFIWLLRTIMKDEILTIIHKKKQEDNIKNSSNINLNLNNMQGEQESEAIINLVNKLVGQIDNRLKECAALETGRNFITNELIPKSMNIDNLSQMDPSWYPWL